MDENLAHMNIVLRKLGKLLQTSGLFQFVWPLAFLVFAAPAPSNVHVSSGAIFRASLLMSDFCVASFIEDTGKICCIIGLFVVLLILFFLVVSP